MGGVIIILTRGMGKWLTYRILRVVFLERLGGLFFDGRRSCIEDYFAGHSGVYFGDFLTVSIVVCELSSLHEQITSSVLKSFV